MQLALESKLNYTERMMADYPRLELMNVYRVIATEQSVTGVKQELNTKSQYRSQVLDRGTRTYESEAAEVKRMEDEHGEIQARKEELSRKLNRLRVENHSDRRNMQKTVVGLKTREVEKEVVLYLDCLCRMRDCLSGLQPAKLLDSNEVSNLTNVDVEAFKALKTMNENRQ